MGVRIRDYSLLKELKYSKDVQRSTSHYWIKIESADDVLEAATLEKQLRWKKCTSKYLHLENGEFNPLRP